MSTEQNRRRNPRYSCNGPAEVQFSPSEPNQPPYPARVLNISAEGALIALATPRITYPNALVELTFTVHHLLFRVRAEAKVIREGDIEIGFEFHNLSPRMLSQMEDLVTELAESEGEHISRLAPLH